jgi:hypothetical protein
MGAGRVYSSIFLRICETRRRHPQQPRKKARSLGSNLLFSLFQVLPVILP